MSTEGKNRPARLTLDEVVRKAKSVTLDDGYHLPTLIVEGSEQSVNLQFEELGDTARERQQRLFVAGLTLAHVGDVGVLQQAFFISEGWMGTSQVGERLERRPSEDPHRKEVLLIFHLQALTNTIAAALFEMIRDHTGKLTDLQAFLSDQTAVEHMESPLLTAFAQGFLAGSRGNNK